MNKDQIKGVAKEMTGKLQKKAGDALGSTSQHVKGAVKEVEGRAQKHLGDLKEVIKDGRKT